MWGALGVRDVTKAGVQWRRRLLHHRAGEGCEAHSEYIEFNAFGTRRDGRGDPREYTTE